MIRLYLETYTLSSALPDFFTIDELSVDFVDVEIALQGEYIYKTRLYANNGVCTFYELRSIVEQNMVKRGLVLAPLEVLSDDGSGIEHYEDRYIVFSRYKDANYSDEYFLAHHFLVSRSYYSVPRNRYASVQFFATETEVPVATYQAVYEKDGQIQVYSAQQSITRYNRPFVYSIHVSPELVDNLVKAKMGGDCGKLLSFSLIVGERALAVYVIEEEPCEEFYFRNAYNALEYMFVFGTTTLKTEISRKEALMQQRTFFYDKSVTRKAEVKTAPMTIEEANWFNEFLEADFVQKDINDGYGGYQVLISDISSEITDSPKERISIKFSWRFDDNSLWVDNSPRERDFTNQFNLIYT